jgi:iron-sulfur cluster assembly protein
MTITLTQKAQSRLQEFLAGSASDAKPTKGIRVLAKDGGCNGYEYGMEVTSSPKSDDIVIEQGQVLIFVDAKSAPLLEGMVIDFVEGVIESGFKFTNPNATNTCSCGKSFSAGNCTPTGTPCK